MLTHGSSAKYFKETIKIASSRLIIDFIQKTYSVKAISVDGFINVFDDGCLVATFDIDHVAGMEFVELQNYVDKFISKYRNENSLCLKNAD